MTDTFNFLPGVYRFNEILVRREAPVSIPINPAIEQIYAGIISEGADESGRFTCNGTSVFNNPVTRISFAQGDKTSLEVGLSESYYVMRKAFSQFVEGRGIDFEEPESARNAMAYNPLIANASILAVIRHRGEYFLVSHVRGAKEVGSGSILSVLAAGHVDTDVVKLKDGLPEKTPFYDPLTATLDHEIFDEVGLKLADIERTRFRYMVVEGRTGAVNIGCVARGILQDEILTAYEAISKSILQQGNQPEVGGIVFVPIEPSARNKPMQGYLPTSEGLEQRTICHYPRRPYTVQVEKFLMNADNRRTLLEDAGF